MTQNNILYCILAAGFGRRMAAEQGFKLLASLHGAPLITHAARAAIAAHSNQMPVVITGHHAPDVEMALKDLEVECHFNPDFPTGMASSLICAVKIAQKRHAAGLMVMLGDMPFVTAAALTMMQRTFVAHDAQPIIRASHSGKPGNPVLLPASLFPALCELKGDQGAKSLLATCGLRKIDVEIGAAAFQDVDDLESLLRAGGNARQC